MSIQNKSLLLVSFLLTFVARTFIAFFLTMAIFMVIGKRMYSDLPTGYPQVSSLKNKSYPQAGKRKKYTIATNSAKIVDKCTHYPLPSRLIHKHVFNDRFSKKLTSRPFLL